MGVLRHFYSIQGLKKIKTSKNEPVFPEYKVFICAVRCTHSSLKQSRNYAQSSALSWTPKIEKKNRRLNFVSFSGLENSDTKFRDETKLSGDSKMKISTHST